MAKGAHWELVCSEVSRPFAIETFRLKVPNGWIYCNTITRRACLHEMNFRSLMFLYPIERGPNHRHSHNQRSLVVLSKSSIARRRTDISCECSSVVRFSHQTLSDRSHPITFVRA